MKAKFDIHLRSYLTVHEVGWLLQKRESEVPKMLDRGELRPAAPTGNIDVGERQVPALRADPA